MAKEFKVIHEFLDTVGGTASPVIRKVGENYPPRGVRPSGMWLDYLISYRTKEGEPILEAKTAKNEEVSAVAEDE